MKVLCVFTQYNYGDPKRGVSIEYASFLPAIQSLGHEVRHLETWDPEQHPTYASLNRGLLALADEWLPDLIFTVQRDYELWIETLGLLAAKGIALATWITDDSFKFNHYSRFIGNYYDGVGTTYDYRLQDYKNAGIPNAMYTQWAANEEWLNAPRAANECKYQITFIGTQYGERAAQIDRLRKAGFDITCFGYGWPAGPVDTDAIPRIMRDSVISLNFSSGFRSDGVHSRQLKARTFEVPGAGGFLLSEHAPSIEQFYRVGAEIDVFDGEADLEAKLAFYLSQPGLRNTMAQAAYERTRKEHLYRFRIRDLFDFALENRTSRMAAAAAGGMRQQQQLVERPLRSVERCLRAFLRVACACIWGKQRAAKAARRLTFEASVRLLGARTFTANSLPGRLFPYL